MCATVSTPRSVTPTLRVAMDGEPFFDRLYRRFHVSFPCYAVLRPDGRGFATEPADDGTEALVLLLNE